MKRYRVRLAPKKWRWPTAQVAGREFTREPMELQEVELTEEIRNSPLLVVEELPQVVVEAIPVAAGGDVDASEDALSEGVDATDGARALAEEMGVPLGAVVGSGAGGRVTKRDVERAMGVADD